MVPVQPSSSGAGRRIRGLPTGRRCSSSSLACLLVCGAAAYLLSNLGGSISQSFVTPRAAGRREVAALLPAAAAAVFGLSGASPARAQAAAKPVINIDLPDRISEDPYNLIGVDPSDEAAARKEFELKRNYKSDTYQVVKHMKISGSLDKGAPRMEQWNMRIKEEMDDWLALYRRQENQSGRQSYYELYSAVNTLASHITSYGPKFPFPQKRRPRLYQLINTVEKYLEKGK